MPCHKRLRKKRRTSSKRKFKHIVEKCIMVASRASAKRRLHALGQCVKRML